MAVEGGAQAVSRLVDVVVEDPGGRSVMFRMPNLLGALIIKAAAAVADGRDRGRHLGDAVLLASLVTDHKAVLTQLHGSDRRRLLALARLLADPYAAAWTNIDSAARTRAQDTLRILTQG
jgi:hypothetical protein